jgi:hypothetical protein
MSHNHQTRTHVAERATRKWFEQVVLGLNLCPFAHRPARQQQIRFTTSLADNEQELLQDVIREIQLLENTPVVVYETTLVITPKLLKDFYDYQFFLEEANYQLKQYQWQGVFQIASFHPNYCFAGNHPDDPANLTNRSPYPVLHILREASLTDILSQVEAPDSIPIRNIKRVTSLSENEIARLFPHINNNNDSP